MDSMDHKNYYNDITLFIILCLQYTSCLPVAEARHYVWAIMN